MEENRKPGDPVLGAELRRIRKEAKLTQDELGALLGINGPQVSRIESGTRGASVDTLHQWYRECGYELEAVEVGSPEQATRLAVAVAALPPGQLDAIIEIVRAWPALDERTRGRMLGLAASHEP
jgi:transcriptional regulator with XRE-family HTH domain